MFLRKITQEEAYPRPPAEAFENARQALLRIGKVKSADEAAGVLTGSVPGGGWVTLHITVLPAESGSRLAPGGSLRRRLGRRARRGIDLFLNALPNPRAGGAAAVPPRSIVQTPRSFEDGLTMAQKISVVMFFGLTCLSSLDVAWGPGLFPLSLEWLYALAAAGGAVTGLILVQPRYRIVGMLSGAVTGLCRRGLLGPGFPPAHLRLQACRRRHDVARLPAGARSFPGAPVAAGPPVPTAETCQLRHPGPVGGTR